MPKRILIIDNEKDILEALETVFVYHGYEVKCESQTENIFKLIDDYQPHLILLDYILTGISGGELCHKIKTNPATMHLPVIIISGYSKVLKSLGDYGCNAFIEKPFEMEDLLQTVSSLLSEQTTLQE